MRLRWGNSSFRVCPGWWRWGLFSWPWKCSLELFRVFFSSLPHINLFQM